MGHQAKVKRARRWARKGGHVNNEPRVTPAFWQSLDKYAKRLQVVVNKTFRPAPPLPR